MTFSAKLLLQPIAPATLEGWLCLLHLSFTLRRKRSSVEDSRFAVLEQFVTAVAADELQETD